MNFLIIALDVECDEFPLRDSLQGDARRFCPHISVLPRFTVDNADAIALFDFDRRKDFPSTIELRGPKEINNRLEWYECGPIEQGFDELVRAHHRMVSQFSPVIQMSDAQHWGRHYRPHMTIRSNDVATVSLNLPDIICVRPIELVLYEYTLSEREPAKRRRLLFD